MRNKGGLRVSLKLYAKNTYTIMKKYKFWRVLYERTNHQNYGRGDY